MNDWEQYEVDSNRTEKKFPDGKVLSQYEMELLHAVIGISTESGELLDAFKKHLIYGKELDLVNVAEEIGDLMWYVSIVTRYLNSLEDISLQDILNKNISKLKARYPEKFTEEKALNRDLDKEREVLEGNDDSPGGC